MYKSSNLFRYALGIIYFHFGILKFFADLSSAEMIAQQTIMKLSFHIFDAHTSIFLLAIMEVLIGLGFLLNIKLKWTLNLFFFHMAGTFIPLFAIPEIVYKFAPFSPTLEGQYILKNIVFVIAAWIILVPESKMKNKDSNL